MALCGRVVLIFQVLQLSFVHSSLIPEKNKGCGQVPELKVVFTNIEIICGQQVPLDTFIDEKAPTVKYSAAEDGKKYSILMVDPDAPSADNPTCRSWLHWNVGNIDGKDLKAGSDFSGSSKPPGELFTGYKRPSPPSGTHRYFLYVFEQKQPLDNPMISNRCGFSIDTYIENSGLKPVAMNMFTVVSKK